MSKLEPISAGDNGSYFVKEDDKIVAIFKPKNEEQGTGHAKNLKTRIKFIFKKLLCFLKNESFTPGKCYLSEVFANKLDKNLMFKIVPETTIETIEGKVGSKQDFVEGAVSALEFYKIPKWMQKSTLITHIYLSIWGNSKQIEYDEFQKMVIMDFLLGNTDRHLGNFLVKDGKIILIDNGNSMSEKPASRYVDKRHQYYWKYLIEANQCFSITTSTGTLESLANNMLDEENKSAFNDQQKRHFAARIETLQTAMQNKWSFKQLAQTKVTVKAT